MSHARRPPSMLVVFVLAGCAAPTDSGHATAAAVTAGAGAGPGAATIPADWPFLTSTTLGAAAFAPLGAPRRVTRAMERAEVAAALPSEAPPPPPPPPPSVSPAAQLLPALTGGTFDRSYGALLEAALADVPADRADLGLAGLDGDELFGTDGTEALCEDVHIGLEVDGAEVSLSVPPSSWFAGPLERDRAPLPDTCVAALLATGGDVDAAGCDEADVRAHFPDGSICRTCLEEDGDHARCVATEACAETATWQVHARGNWYGVLHAPLLLCAPDHVVDGFVLVEDLAEADPLPETFDHGAVSGVCAEAWDGENVDFYCTMGDQHALGDVLYSRVDYIRPVGDPSTPWAGRVSLVASLEVEGLPFATSWLWEKGGTGISAPMGSVVDGWGINPRDLRPGGVDPANPEDTFARDYIAAFTLKLLTERDGVPVAPANRNRCDDDAWEGPFEDGTYACDEPGAWSTDGMRDDALVAWWDQSAGEVYAFPLVTLASTGLPDPDVAGGLLTEVLGSTTLMDAEWEACTWPKTFVPDRVRLYDPTPATSDAGYASFDGQTYRLGRDPEEDVRLFLATNEVRGFCP